MATLSWLTRFVMMICGATAINFALVGLTGINLISKFLSLFKSSMIINVLYIIIGLSGLILIYKMK